MLCENLNVTTTTLQVMVLTFIEDIGELFTNIRRQLYAKLKYYESDVAKEGLYIEYILTTRLSSHCARRTKDSTQRLGPRARDEKKTARTDSKLSTRDIHSVVDGRACCQCRPHVDSAGRPVNMIVVKNSTWW